MYKSMKNRGVQDGTGPEGKGATGRRLGSCNDEDDEDEKEEVKKSKISLVITPGSEGLEKAVKLSKVGSKHAAGKVTGHTERMKLAKLAAIRMQEA